MMGFKYASVTIVLLSCGVSCAENEQQAVAPNTNPNQAQTVKSSPQAVVRTFPGSKESASGPSVVRGAAEAPKKPNKPKPPVAEKAPAAPAPEAAPASTPMKGGKASAGSKPMTASQQAQKASEAEKELKEAAAELDKLQSELDGIASEAGDGGGDGGGGDGGGE